MCMHWCDITHLSIRDVPDDTVGRALHCKLPSCGLKSGPYLCLWDLFHRDVTPQLYVSGVTSVKGLTGSMLDHISLPPEVESRWWAYLKGVSSLTSLHYLWRSPGPFSLPCAQKWP